MFESFVATDVGVKRKSNEDNFCTNMEIGLLVVADGMGGHAAGEVASRIAVQEIEQSMLKTQGISPGNFSGFEKEYSLEGNRLRRAIRLANDKIRKTTVERSECRGMGTTIVASIMSGLSCTIAHVGDSRAYLYRDKDLVGLTSDHSWVNEQLRQGFLTEEQTRNHPFRNVITQALGSGPDVKIDVMEIKLRANDLLLLCSDGLNSMLPDREINNILRKGFDNELDHLTFQLINAAKERGGDDNITVGLLRMAGYIGVG